MRICLSGYYFVGSRGDELLRETITESLSPFGKVKTIYCESKDYRAIDWCDVLVVGGGTLANSRGIGGYAQVKYAKSKNKKIMFYANSIEEGDPLLDDYLKCADVITVRDSESHSLCQTRGFNSFFTADPAVRKYQNQPIHVGLRRWVTEPKDFVEKMASVLDELAVANTVVLTPYVTKATDTISDVEFSKIIVRRMSHKARVSVFKDDQRPNIYVGMRMHSIISSTMRLIPTLAIDYDSKVGNYMRLINQGNFIVGYNSVQAIPGMVRKINNWQIIDREKDNVNAFKKFILI